MVVLVADDASFALHASGKLVEITGRTAVEVWVCALVSALNPHVFNHFCVY